MSFVQPVVTTVKTGLPLLGRVKKVGTSFTDALRKLGRSGADETLEEYVSSVRPTVAVPPSPTYTPNPANWIDSGLPVSNIPTAPIAPATFAPGLRGAVQSGTAIKRAKQAEKARRRAEKTGVATPPRGAFQRVLETIVANPIKTGIPLTAAGLFGAGIARDIFSGAGQPGVDYSQIKIPTEAEAYLSQVEKLGRTAYSTDPTLQLNLYNQAMLSAERAAAGYEEIGRPDLAEAARQNIMNQFNQFTMAQQLQQQQSFSELAAQAQGEAAKKSSALLSPSQIREQAEDIASIYFGLSDEDKAFYAARGYDTPEKFIQGRINGEI